MLPLRVVVEIAKGPLQPIPRFFHRPELGTQLPGIQSFLRSPCSENWPCDQGLTAGSKQSVMCDF